MSKTLTHTEIIQVFSTYLGSAATIQCQKYDSSPFQFLGARYNDFFRKVELILKGDFSGGTHCLDQESPVPVSDGCLLRLKHYGQLTDQQCLEALNYFIIDSGQGYSEKVEHCRYKLKIMYEESPFISYLTYRHLALLGVDVPHYFGYNHWANGKTTTELGLGILVKY